VRTLVARGAKLDAKTDVRARRAVRLERQTDGSAQGYTTALHAAAEARQLDCMRLLLDAGAETEARDMVRERVGWLTPARRCC
jgi:hypothetical protein